ncbi:MAG: carboxypeptidase-like regulatory domain-containing protein [Pyrinomonadaceae bacterium]
MNNENFDINTLRVASPCSVGWETMTGDDRVRSCNSCQLNIYNTAEMTKAEVVNLIENHEGRLCIRLHKRADGTVITKDCPVGIRAYRKRAAQFAGAAFTAILGLFSTSYSQNSGAESLGKAQTVGTQNKDSKSELRGTVADANGAVILNATVKLFMAESEASIEVKSGDAGEFVFEKLAEGLYRIEVTAKHFKKTIYQNVKIGRQTKVRLDINLEIEDDSVVVGIFFEEPLIDMRSTGITHTVFKRDN